MSKLRLVVASDLRAVGAASECVRRHCQASGLSEADVFAIELSIAEATNNAIEHAYGSRPGNEVEVEVDFADEVVIEVRDRGSPMPENALQRAHLPSPDRDDLASLPERGMGLAIIREVMSEVSYVSANGVNTLRLIRRPTPTQEATQEAPSPKGCP